MNHLFENKFVISYFCIFKQKRCANEHVDYNFTCNNLQKADILTKKIIQKNVNLQKDKF